MSVIDINDRIEALNRSRNTLSTTALASLVEHVVKVLMHVDGTHGVSRRYCEPETVLERAKTQSYILLDLGHVIRMYFGDDYFDLHLDTHVPYERNESFSMLVEDVVAENKQNDGRV
ncbi:MAG: hypothetical protein K6L80_01645 [Agarilytica sp.]